MKTYYAKPNEVEREWVLIDAENQVLGRVAAKRSDSQGQAQAAVHAARRHRRLRGHHQRGQDPRDGHEGPVEELLPPQRFPRRLKSETFEEAMAKHPERVIEHAVKGMLPKNTLGRAMGKKLKVYTGAEHPHMAQQPREIKMEG